MQIYFFKNDSTHSLKVFQKRFSFFSCKIFSNNIRGPGKKKKIISWNNKEIDKVGEWGATSLFQLSGKVITISTSAFCQVTSGLL